MAEHTFNREEYETRKQVKTSLVSSKLDTSATNADIIKRILNIETYIGIKEYKVQAWQTK